MGKVFVNQMSNKGLCCAKSHQSCVTLWPHGLHPPGFSVNGILQARILEGVAMPSTRGSSQPRDRTQVSHVSYFGRRVLYHYTTWGALDKGLVSRVWGSPGRSAGKESACNVGDPSSIPGLQRSEEDMATHFGFLVWRIPVGRGPGRLQSPGSQRVGHHWATRHTHAHIQNM